MQAKELRKKLVKVLPYLIEARMGKMNEADTSQRICNVFTEVLGYDTYKDINKEVFLREKKADVILKINGDHRIVVEIKAAAEKLKLSHIDQAKAYGAVNGIEWVLLTNGIDWNLYHISFSKKGITENLAFDVDLSDDTTMEEACEHLTLLHYQPVKNNELDFFRAKAKALNPTSLSKVLFTEDTMTALRRELRHQHNLLIDIEQIAQTLWRMFDHKIQIELGPMHLKKKKKVASKTASPAVVRSGQLQEVSGQSKIATVTSEKVDMPMLQPPEHIADLLVSDIEKN